MLAMGAAPETCAAPDLPPGALTNGLATPLRLLFLPDDPSLASDFPHPSKEWLAPRQALRLGAAPSAGWLVAERRIWHGVTGAATRTSVVRRAFNDSMGSAVAAGPYTPLAPVYSSNGTFLHQAPASSNGSFLLLVNAERVPLRVCSDGVVGAERGACHGLLAPLARRYLREAAASGGPALGAYEAVWGERWPAAQSPAEAHWLGRPRPRLRGHADAGH